ncbi:MAG: hypothetical protein ACLT5H_10090 [Collinsella stercoris]|uniref:hypothetical protein n=1 Tax=Collinsella stercoris TaxID=147206 RepID=UPI003991CAA3
MFEPDALHEIARKALARKTGARGLRSICEERPADHVRPPERGGRSPCRRYRRGGSRRGAAASRLCRV